MAGDSLPPTAGGGAYSHGVGWVTRTLAHLAGWRRPLDPVGSGLLLVDGPVREPHLDHRPLLRRIAAEAVILQDDAVAVMHGIRARQNLGDLAPPGGPLVRRFFELRDRLPARCVEPADDHLRGRLDAILHHHAMALHPRWTCWHGSGALLDWPPRSTHSTGLASQPTCWTRSTESSTAILERERLVIVADGPPAVLHAEPDRYRTPVWMGVVFRPGLTPP